MKKAIYPGSFDPVTLGHMDVISRSAKLAKELVVVVMVNEGKRPMFSIEERVELLEQVTNDIKNVRVEYYNGLLVDFAKKEQADVIVRGLRAVTDFEYELQMAQTNRVLVPQIDTLFLTTKLEYSYLSSSIVKEVAGFGGDISRFVPDIVREQVMKKVNSGRRHK